MHAKLPKGEMFWCLQLNLKSIKEQDGLMHELREG